MIPLLPWGEKVSQSASKEICAVHDDGDEVNENNL